MPEPNVRRRLKTRLHWKQLLDLDSRHTRLDGREVVKTVDENNQEKGHHHAKQDEQGLQYFHWILLAVNRRDGTVTSFSILASC